MSEGALRHPLTSQSPPDGDPATIRLLQEGRTLGCCQLESPAMRHLLCMLKPESVHRVIQALALIRPAPASIGMKEVFVRRARGLEPVRMPHPSLRDILGDTYGIMLYEDDAMLVGSALAGISLEEGDRLRKAIKKSATREELANVSRYFLGRAIRNGIPRHVAEEMWVQMAKFTEYSFCRSHAAGYGLVAYHEAYLKAHHPAAYMTAALNNVQGVYPNRVYVWEAKRLGVEVLPPCVNRSAAEYAYENGAIRMGLSRVRNLKAATIRALIEARGDEQLSSLRDAASRVSMSLPELENLALAGAFDFTGLARPKLVWQARAFHATPDTRRAGQKRLMVADDTDNLPYLAEYSLEQKVCYEIEVLECPLSAHPAALARKRYGGSGLAYARDLPRLVGRTVHILGIANTGRTTHTTDGREIEFITFEDETGVFDVTILPEQGRSARYAAGPVSGDHPLVYLLTGTVESRYGAITVRGRPISQPRISPNLFRKRFDKHSFCGTLS